MSENRFCRLDAYSSSLNEVQATADNTREISVGGKWVKVPALDCDVNGKTVVVMGKWIKTASVKDEELVEGDAIPDPELFVSKLKASKLKADIFTFAQKLPDIIPKYTYHSDWDNRAVIAISSFAEWWGKRVESSVRRAVRKATRLGVVVKPVEFDDAFVQGIVDIYNETPIRQGKFFWHYQKDFDAVRRDNSTYLERSAYLGAYYNDELIGFIRMVYVDKVAHIIQALSKMKHFDKRPTNALIAKAVEICEEKGVSHLVYCNYQYNDPNSSLTEFKRRSGFEQVLLPRYHIPLTLKGKIALMVKLHHRLADHVPQPALAKLRKIRRLWHDCRFQIARSLSWAATCPEIVGLISKAPRERTEPERWDRPDS